MSGGVLAGRVALVTGAARGIGAGIARAMVREGAAVSVSSPALAELDECLAGLRALGGTAHGFACDVTDRAQVDAWVADAVRALGRVDILVNNAAFTGFAMPGVEDVAADDLRRHVEVDVVGSLHCMQACFPHLRERGGAVVNFGSNAATTGYVGETGYAVAKEGVRGLTKVAAAEWGQYGITVNVVAPTSRTEALVEWLAGQPEGTEERLNAAVPARRLGDPEHDIGAAVVALASPLSRYVTGRTIFVDGGRGGFR